MAGRYCILFSFSLILVTVAVQAMRNINQILKCNKYFIRRKCTDIPSVFVNIGGSSLTGRTHIQENEDRYTIQRFQRNIKYFNVLDGHNGSFVSDFVNRTLPEIVKEKILRNSHCLYDGVFEVVEQCLLESFSECQDILKEFIESAENLKRKDMVGSTAVVGLLIDNNYLTIANVGDSKAILCRSGRPIELSVEHIPENQQEAERVIAAGGWIDWDSKFKPLIGGRLSMTRSFGNLLLKSTGVISRPSIHHQMIDDFLDSFVVLCSDGITHSMTDEEIVYIVSQHDEPNYAAEDLTTTSQQYGSDDDATAVVVPLGGWRSMEIKTSRIDYSMFRTVVGCRSGG